MQLTVNVFSIRVRQAGGSVAMSGEPLRLAVVVDAITAGLDVGVQIRTVVPLANAVGNGPWVYLLQYSPIIEVLGTLALELLRALTKQTPVLLEDSEVGGVAGLVFAYEVERSQRGDQGWCCE